NATERDAIERGLQILDDLVVDALGAQYLERAARLSAHRIVVDRDGRHGVSSIGNARRWQPFSPGARPVLARCAGCALPMPPDPVARARRLPAPGSLYFPPGPVQCSPATRAALPMHSAPGSLLARGERDEPALDRCRARLVDRVRKHDDP